MTFCFYCGRIGHSDRACEFKKLDVQRKITRAGQFGDWLRGNFVNFSDSREYRSSSQGNTIGQTTESSKAKEIVPQRGSLVGSRSPIQQVNRLGSIGGVNNNTDKECGELELLGNNQEAPEDHVQDLQGNKGSSSPHMEMDGTPMLVLESPNMVEVIVNQDATNPSLSTKKKTFVRIARTKHAEGSPTSPEGQESGMGPSQEGILLKRKEPEGVSEVATYFGEQERQGVGGVLGSTSATVSSSTDAMQQGQAWNEGGEEDTTPDRRRRSSKVARQAGAGRPQPRTGVASSNIIPRSPVPAREAQHQSASPSGRGPKHLQGEKITYLKEKIDDFEGVETDLKASVKDMRRVLGERDEMLNFMSKGGCEATVTATSVVEKAMVAWN
ncbi:DNA repair metallo-beta-lactamase family protein [Striga asiatica]|uniref:DNA repair metallo-beta-lactamase family protein n=1 Tax=Striga asiatica TaxID=4170 RepID=A0A5A7RDZ5_STRAF|nr:DNA repair metallo-beta-lactamase family protein [Striga asiatica]